MAKSKKPTESRRDPIPEAGRDLRALSDFWDTHSAADYWDEFKSVDVEFNIDITPRYVALEKSLARRLRAIAEERGVSVETLVNLWVHEKVS
jgi:hypothetical protein